VDIDKLKPISALRVSCNQDDLGQAAAELCNKAKEEELLPCVMTFEMEVDYEETGGYQVVLWGT